MKRQFTLILASLLTVLCGCQKGSQDRQTVTEMKNLKIALIKIDREFQGKGHKGPWSEGKVERSYERLDRAIATVEAKKGPAIETFKTVLIAMANDEKTSNIGAFIGTNADKKIYHEAREKVINDAINRIK